MEANWLINLFIIVIFVAGVYFLLVAPRQREYRQRQQFVSDVTPGTDIVTYGGVIGTVLDVNRDTGVVTVEIADGVVVRVVAAAIMHEYDPEEYAASTQRALGKSTDSK